MHDGIGWMAGVIGLVASVLIAQRGGGADPVAEDRAQLPQEGGVDWAERPMRCR